MSPRIMIVLDKPDFVEDAVRALAAAELEAMCFSDPSAAWETLDSHQDIDLLITKPRFPAGVQNGVSLALTAKMSRPGLKVLFVSRPEYLEAVADVGVVLPFPVAMPVFVATVEALLAG